MRSIAHITGPATRLAALRLVVLRLLAAVLALGLLAPSLTAGAHAHEHGSATVVTAEAPHAASDAAPDGACLACHVHCGCHVGVPFSETDRETIAPVSATIAIPKSDRGRLSALDPRVIRPPRS